MPYHRNVFVAAFAMAVAFSRLAFRSRELCDLESVKLRPGMVHFIGAFIGHPRDISLHLLRSIAYAHSFVSPNLALVHADGVEFVTGPVLLHRSALSETASGASCEQCVSGVSVQASAVNNRAHMDGR
jgi:hypothetical protein